MYGISTSIDELDEYSSEKNPVTEYAKTKWNAEKYLTSLNDKDFYFVFGAMFICYWLLRYV